MAILQTELLQALADAGITDKAQATRLFRKLLKMVLLESQNDLAIKAMLGVLLTDAEIAEIQSNEAALANLAIFKKPKTDSI